MSNKRRLMVLNPGSGLRQRRAWAGGKIKVQLRRHFLAQQAEKKEKK